MKVHSVIGNEVKLINTNTSSNLKGQVLKIIVIFLFKKITWFFIKYKYRSP